MVQSEIANARRDIHIINTKYYSGKSPDRAFAHWALKCLIADLEPNDTILPEFTAVGGPNDLGIDAYYIDEANQRLILVQAKDSKAVQRKDVMEFREAISSLRNEEYVTTFGNLWLREVYPIISDHLYDESYAIHAVFASGGSIRQAASAYCELEGSRPLEISDEDTNDSGSFYYKEITLEAMGIAELAERARQLSAMESPFVALRVATLKDEPCLHYMSGVFESALATVQARSLAQAYDKHRSAIFRYNPRGPQGSNRTNKDIKETIEDPTQRQYFHLFNNGITVVCDSVQYYENDNSLAIQDFQVVNGCQTVYTLYESINSLTADILVNVRIIAEGKASGLIPSIAKASNSQTAVKTHQLASMGAEHNRITEILASGDQPWYYEKQLGQPKFNTSIQQRVHQDKYDDRTVTIYELGQYGSAFIGYPALSKYDLKAVFEKRGKSGMTAYDRIFKTPATKEQLLLPVLLGRKVFAEVDSQLKKAKAETDSQGFSIIDWLKHARHHLIALVGTAANRTPGTPRLDLLTPETSSERIASIEEWFDEYFRRAYESIRTVILVERRAGKLTNIRNFFRDQDRYIDMLSEMRQSS